MILAWLTCLEALGLTKGRDDLIEEALEYMLANFFFFYGNEHYTLNIK